MRSRSSRQCPTALPDRPLSRTTPTTARVDCRGPGRPPLARRPSGRSPGGRRRLSSVRQSATSAEPVPRLRWRRARHLTGTPAASAGTAPRRPGKALLPSGGRCRRPRNGGRPRLVSARCRRRSDGRRTTCRQPTRPPRRRAGKGATGKARRRDRGGRRWSCREDRPNLSFLQALREG